MGQLYHVEIDIKKKIPLKWFCGYYCKDYRFTTLFQLKLNVFGITMLLLS